MNRVRQETYAGSKLTPNKRAAKQIFQQSFSLHVQLGLLLKSDLHEVKYPETLSQSSSQYFWL